VSARPSAVTLLAGAEVLLPDAVRLERRDVLVADGRIAALLPPGADAPADAVRRDLSGHVVAPGFIDGHVHGGAGSSFMSAGPGQLAAIGRHLAAGGVTSCLATTVSAGRAELQDAVGRIAAACGPPAEPGVELLGIHLEGPFLDPAHRGVHRARDIRAATRDELTQLLDAAAGTLRVVTLAPERPGGLEAVELLASHGVIPAIGHSGASFEDARRAIAAGVRRVTHAFNGLAPIHHRAPGPMPALLREPSVHVEVIADGRHVAPEMIAFTAAVVGPGRLMAVSDGSDVAGLPDGEHSRWEGTPVVVAGATVSTPDGSVAGGGSRLDAHVRLLAGPCGLGAAAALDAVTRVPAEALGLGSSKGTLRPGADADLVVLDASLHVVASFARGVPIHETQEVACPSP
jgi:N-acetylglucosamine-6-phosphate deacetylase